MRAVVDASTGYDIATGLGVPQMSGINDIMFASTNTIIIRSGTLSLYKNNLETGNLVGAQTLSSENLTLGHHSVKITDPLMVLWFTDTNHTGESIIPSVKISYDNDEEVNFTGTPYTHP